MKNVSKDSAGQPEEHIWSFRADDPDRFMEGLSPITGETRCVPLTGHKFSGNARASKLIRLGLFSANIENVNVLAPESRNFYSITLSQNHSFKIYRENRLKVFKQ